MRRVVAAILFAMVCISLDLSAEDADAWLSWETPVSQAQDALTDQPWISTDVASEVNDAIVLLPRVERYILADAAAAGLRTIRAADLTRAPPSA